MRPLRFLRWNTGGCAGLTAPAVVQEIGQLQVSVQQELGQLSATITGKLAQVQQIDTAIEVKQSQLKDLYDIEAEAAKPVEAEAKPAESARAEAVPPSKLAPPPKAIKSSSPAKASR